MTTYSDVSLMIDGAWTKGAKGRTIPVINPATEEVIGQCAHAETSDLDRALAAADKGFKQWRKVSAFDRYKIMRKAAELIRQRVDEIAPIMTMEQGKPVIEAKGETLLDTVHTLEAMHCDAFVVRHKESGTPEFIAGNLRSGAAVLNAGDGNRAHPTQGLLDALTLRRHRSDFSKLRVAICGDIRHSRVARSDVHALAALGVCDIRLCAPSELAPVQDEFPQCRIFDDFDEAIADADVAIMLRLQKERMQAAAIPSEAEYFQRYGLSAARLHGAAPGCLVMHPGPINRGVEIASEVADGPQSLILEQVANGVFVRMAVLAELLAAQA
jgi:aspartate carbamoyltransferase catalytic subunit